ncbi:Uma2 family endonuclease [Butyrivibrio sp. WCE2006]|uniref:Uma2 family endonuclease n=1 Tax=Butyrivibrio sp. WCE2006 TaxID=1410611 RepID=UPI0005D25443|nr:Uma2 family endonuclease [Butyrivibrio sp. WCE2006]
MTIEEMNKIKESRGYSFAQLSDYTGVPVVTLQRIFAGATRNPRKATLDAIEKVLMGDESVYTGRAYAYEQNSSVSYPEYEEATAGLSEKEFVYGDRSVSGFRRKKDGDYTVNDYYSLSKDKWVELIDGSLYDLAVPGPVHQMISGLVFECVHNFIRKNNIPDIVIYAPVDVQFEGDDKTVVKPDIIIVCDRNKVKDKGIFGAPDFIMEIIAPDTRRRDMFVKSDKYCKAGVKEYLMIDPKKRVLISYNFMDEDVTPVTVPLKGEYEISLYEGKLKLNLDEISRIIKEFAE